MKIILTEALPEFEFIKEVTEKTMIVLHHTVSAVGKNVDDWFKSDRGKSRVAVSFVVDKDGSIYQLFDPKYWAYHIGAGSQARHNRKSIGIEIVNEGPLYRIASDEYRWWIDNNYPRGRYLYENAAFESPVEWRGYHYFASYTDEQYKSVEDLLDFLLPEFHIKRRIYGAFEYDSRLLEFQGVIMHCNVRQDKTDPSVAFDINRIAEHILQKDAERLPIAPLYEQPVIQIPREDLQLKSTVVVESDALKTPSPVLVELTPEKKKKKEK